MALPELLDLDAAVFADYWNAVLDEVAAASRDVRRVVDLGSGTGTGALGLAHRFPGAEIVAVDSSEEMLAAVAAKDPRITTLLVDLDAAWPDLGVVDITFASMALHHMSDPAHILRQLFGTTSQGGIVALAEFRDPVLVLRDEFGDGAERRTIEAMRAGHPLPELAADWAARLTDAGFELVTERTFDIDVQPPLTDDAHRYATLWLERLQDRAGDHGVANHAFDSVTSDDLHLHGRRFLTVARRP